MVSDTVTVMALEAVAVEACRRGGAAAMRHFRRADLAVETKADDSPVTVADRTAEDTIRAYIEAVHPQDGWLGEETGTRAGSSGRDWIVDPIDGTKNFIHGIPLWSTLVACREHGEVVAGAVAMPALGEVYSAARGCGARCDGVPIRVSGTTDLAQALWCYETRSWWAEAGMAAVFDRLMSATRMQRGLCDAYAHMLVASGRADVVIEPALSLWDLAAPSIVVAEAGGRVSTRAGGHDLAAGHAVVTNGHLHDAVLACIAEYQEAP